MFSVSGLHRPHHEIYVCLPFFGSGASAEVFLPVLSQHKAHDELRIFSVRWSRDVGADVATVLG